MRTRRSASCRYPAVPTAVRWPRKASIRTVASSRSRAMASRNGAGRHGAARAPRPRGRRPTHGRYPAGCRAPPRCRPIGVHPRDHVGSVQRRRHFAVAHQLSGPVRPAERHLPSGEYAWTQFGTLVGIRKQTSAFVIWSSARCRKCRRPIAATAEFGQEAGSPGEFGRLRRAIQEEIRCRHTPAALLLTGLRTLTA